ncbi:MAG TPA: ABC-type transport auxiliary lipoprotein family protein [Ramlibacter sp.]|nr:ABC-type transport auxiliary lipoprotein family protein [Ramlibacter sp.]
MSARRIATLAALLAAGWLSGCGITPERPMRATLYDFGVGAAPASAGTAASSTQAAVVLADIDAAGALDGSSVLYRLAYTDANQLRPYALARWSAPPPQLVRQRLREQLGRERAVLNAGESASLARNGGASPRVLRIELEEFSHVFESATQSHGLLRLRATLFESRAEGESLLGQRAVVVRRPAASGDAPGGVRALASATDAAADELAQWLRQQP